MTMGYDKVVMSLFIAGSSGTRLIAVSAKRKYMP